MSFKSVVLGLSLSLHISGWLPAGRTEEAVLPASLGCMGPHDPFWPVSWEGKSCVSLDSNIELLRDSPELLILLARPLQLSRK